MAAADIGSRRKCEQLIAEGRVEVNRQVVVAQGMKVDPDKDEVRVDGIALKPRRLVYYLVNKPPGVVSTNFDPAGRIRVIDLVPARDRVYTVGRLDRMSEGLMLVTNDGDLANRLAHPRFGVQKTYQVVVAGEPTKEALLQLIQGVHLAEGVAHASRVVVLSSHGQSTQLEIVLREGKNREIRRILAKLGHKVLRLRRIAIDGIKLKNLPPGSHRRLTAQELGELRGASSHRHPPADRPEARPRVFHSRRARLAKPQKASPARKVRR